MRQVFDLIERVARTSVSVTFVGETGTGKDVLANATHLESPRARAPFVVFDCGAVAANLALGSVATSWTVDKVGDFNGDARADILWRNTAGTAAIWLMNGATVIGTSGLGTIPTSWSTQ